MTAPTRDLSRFVGNRNVLLAGGTGVGKSGGLQLFCRSFARNPAEAFTLIDPHGSVARPFIEWAANPANGVSQRVIHFYDGSDYTFGINPLDSGEEVATFDDCHDCASLLVAIIANFFDQQSEATPRMVRLVYVAAFVCTFKKLTLLEVLELFALGAHELRRSVLQDFNNSVVRRELEDLIALADQHPQRFIELVESTKNRLVRWLASPRMARIFACKSPIKPRRIMDGRENLVVDLSSFSIDDGAFVATALTTQYFAEAKRRPPDACARHRLIGDEFEAMIVDYTAKLVSQTRKFGLSLICAVQYLSQLLAKGQFVADAILSNCHLKLIFGGLTQVDAKIFADLVYTGHLNVGAEWIPGTERPVVTGHEKALVRSSSRTEHEAEHRTHAMTRSHTHGEAHGTMSSTSASVGDFSASGDAHNLTMQAPAQLFGPSAPGAQMLPVPLTQTDGSNRSSGSSEMSGTSTGESHVEVEMFGEAETTGYGRSTGTSVAEGLSEVFVPVLEWLPSARYSLDELLHRAQGVIMNLQPRSCLVKIAGEPPFIARTETLSAPFRSAYFKRLILPRFQCTIAERSPYMLRVTDVDAQIAARVTTIVRPRTSPPADFSPAPMPVVDAPSNFASDFWSKRAPRLPDPPKAKKRPGRKPSARRPQIMPDLRIIDGGKDEGGDSPPDTKR